MTQTAFVPFARPSVHEEEIQAVVDVLRSGWLSTGSRAQAFEAAFATYVGAPHALALNSCTAALHLGLLACGVGPGDEVITSPLTFCATANAVLHAGGTPVFADVHPHTMNLDPRAAAAAVGSRTRALLPVHFAGRPVDVAAHRALARRHGLALIEDAAHCVEGLSSGEKIGSTADVTCFSFYATKNLVTAEGGMVTTSCPDRARYMRTVSLHGLSRDAWARYGRSAPAQYDVVALGFKYNMPDVLAALGLAQLARLEERLARREAIWRRYDEAFADLPLERPAPVPAGDRHARHLYTVLVDSRRCGRSRDQVRAMLHERGVGTSVHFRALHLQPYYARRFKLSRGAFPNAERISDTTLSLPLSAALADTEVEHVIAALRHAVRADARVNRSTRHTPRVHRASTTRVDDVAHAAAMEPAHS